MNNKKGPIEIYRTFLTAKSHYFKGTFLLSRHSM